MPFASGALLRSVCDALPESLRSITGRQRDAPMQGLLYRHRAIVDAGSDQLMFCLATLAEGVDLVGPYNAHTVIIKLPFAAPDDSVTAAHAEWLEAKGGLILQRPVAAYGVPQAGAGVRSDDSHRDRSGADHDP